MYWNDLNKDNIELIKELYQDYLDDNKEDNYMSNLMSFEDFMQEELVQCFRCGEWTCRGTSHGCLCQVCYDDLHYGDDYPIDEIVDELRLEELRTEEM